MKLGDRKDLRVSRTQQSIRSALAELLLEKPFEAITVTELSRRANINKKTFYRHYSSLEELLEAVQAEFAEPFAKLTSNLQYPHDADAITREFLLYSAEQGPLYDAMALREFHDGLFTHMMDMMGAERVNDPCPPRGWSSEEWALYLAHVVNSQIRIYRQWVRSGRALPVNRMVTLGVRLVCNGASFEKLWRDQETPALPMP